MDEHVLVPGILSIFVVGREPVITTATFPAHESTYSTRLRRRVAIVLVNFGHNRVDLFFGIAQIGLYFCVVNHRKHDQFFLRLDRNLNQAPIFGIVPQHFFVGLIPIERINPNLAGCISGFFSPARPRYGRPFP